MVLEFRRVNLELNVKTVDVNDTSVEVMEILKIVMRAYGLKRKHVELRGLG